MKTYPVFIPGCSKKKKVNMSVNRYINLVILIIIPSYCSPFVGFDPTTLLKACCGVGGSYNYDSNRACGSTGVPVCPNPARYISWDGLHLTQEAYRRIYEIIIADILAKIQCVW